MENNNPPTVQQLLTEGHARLRRMNADAVYLGSLLDLLAAEITEREKINQELRERLTVLEEADPA